METAIGYIRVSDQRQAEDGSSLSTQEKQVRAYAESHQLFLSRLFIEEGESAKTDERHQLQAMLQYCREAKGTVQVVIVPKIDRLARNAFDYANLKLLFKRHGIRLESVGERIEDSPVGRFTETILASAAQFDNEIRAERSKGGMIEAVSEGRWVWKAPMGYRNIRMNGKGTIEPHPKDAEILRKAFEQLASGSSSLQRTRQWMADQGLPVSRSRLYALLHHPAYIGKINAFGKVYDARPPFVPLVGPETMFAARAALQDHRAMPTVYQRDHPLFPLRGTIRCSCGRFLTANLSQGRSQTHAYYRCLRCSRVNIRKETLEDEFIAELRRFEPTPGCLSRLETEVAKRWEERETKRKSRTHDSQERIGSLINLQKALAMKNAAGVIPDELAKDQIEELGRQIGALSTDQEQVQTGHSITEVIAFARTFLADLGLRWHVESLRLQKRLQDFLYPEGLLYIPNSNFRTGDYPLLEQVKKVLHDDQSCLVHPNSEIPNQSAKTHDMRSCKDSNSIDQAEEVFRWLCQLYETFGEEGGVDVE